MRYLARVLLPLVMMTVLILSACDDGYDTLPQTAGPPPTAASNPFASVPAIVNPNNLGWPREVKSSNGNTVTIKAKPERIIALSVGHDEIALALVPASRLVAVSSSTKNAAFSNVADLVKGAATISREPEAILAQRPDVMFSSSLLPATIVEAVSKAGIPVVQTELKNDHQGRINQILLAGYIFGEERRAQELAREVDQRFNAVQAIVKSKVASARRRVGSYTLFSDKLYTAGKNSTEGSIIESAGGINVAAEAGLERNPVINYEAVITMRPEIIIIAQPPDSGEPFRKALLANPVIADVPAVKNGKIYLVDSLLFTTLSHYNVRGVEELAKLLWPSDFAGKEFPPFSKPAP
jgi:iron complex transport system substrate-binding protein